MAAAPDAARSRSQATAIQMSLSFAIPSRAKTPETSSYIAAVREPLREAWIRAKTGKEGTTAHDGVPSRPALGEARDATNRTQSSMDWARLSM